MTTELLSDAAPTAGADGDSTTPPPSSGAPAGRREFFRSCAKGGAFATVTVAALLLMNGVNFLSDSFTNRFYAAQARSLIDRTWAIPHALLGFEGFQHSGSWYMYYGPFPALLRVPFVRLFPSLAERTTQWAILAATIITLICTARMLWHLRQLVRGDRPVTRQERFWAALFVLVVGAGSTLTFLTSQALVYHEAEAWGAAFAVASFDAMLVWLHRPTRTSLIVASACAWVSVMSRGSVGFGPIAALGLLAVAVAWPRVRTLLGVTVDVTRRTAVGLAAATIVPAASYCYVNYAKFGNPFIFPIGTQEMSQQNPWRQHFLATSGGGYFNLKFVPTNLLQYFRPDALRLSWLLPFIGPAQPHVFGGAVYDAVEPTASVPSSMPFLFVLGCVAVYLVFRRRRNHPAGNGFAAARVPLIGAAVGGASVVPFGYLAQRYLSDFLPLLVVAGAVGLQAVLRWSEDRATAGENAAEPTRRHRVSPRAVLSVLAVFAVISVVVNVALAVDYHYTSQWASQEVSAPFVALQYRLHNAFPGGAAPHVEHGASLPVHPAPRGTVFVVGKCEGIYWSPGDVGELAWGPWQGVARSAAAGQYDLSISFRSTGDEHVLEPVVVRGTPGHLQTVAALVGPQGSVRFAFITQGAKTLQLPGSFYLGQEEHFAPGHTYNMRVVMDPNDGHITVTYRGDEAFRMVQFTLTPEQNAKLVFPTNVVHIGANPYDASTVPTFLGTIVSHKVGRPSLCNTLGVK